MFVPPEKRHPGQPPWEPLPPKREGASGDQTVVLWLIGFLLVLTVLAPIGGSTVLNALWYVMSR